MLQSSDFGAKSMQKRDDSLTPRSTTRITRRASHFHGGWRKFVNVVFGLVFIMPSTVAGFFLHEHFFPSQQTISVTIPPKPEPGYYAAFSSNEQPEVAVLLSPNLRIIQVDSYADLPFEVDVSSQKFMGNYRVRDRYGVISFVLLLKGDIDIDIDALSGEQSLAMAVAAKRGEAKRISLDFSAEESRGPPARRKLHPDLQTVFVVGRIRSLQGPTQFKNSLIMGSFTDLSGTDPEYDDYLNRASAWADRVRGLTSKYGPIPESELWSTAAGASSLSFRVVNDHIFPTHGTPMEQSAFDREHRSAAFEESGSHESNTEHVVEVP